MKKWVFKILVLLLLGSFSTELSIDILQATKSAYTLADLKDCDEKDKEEKKEKEEKAEKDKLFYYLNAQIFSDKYRVEFLSYSEVPVFLFTSMPDIPPKQA